MRINIDLLRNILLDVADCPAPTVDNSHCKRDLDFIVKELGISQHCQVYAIVPVL